MGGSVEQAIQLVSLAEQAQSVVFNVDLQEGLVVQANAGQMVQVFVNLLNNACDVSGSGGTVDIVGRAMKESVCLRIRDYGPGIAIADQQRVFEPFYTTKAVGQGTGLGLPLVYSLVKVHGGKITIDPSVTNGVCFEIVLPAVNALTD